jgi:hypothetical protein
MKFGLLNQYMHACFCDTGCYKGPYRTLIELHCDSDDIVVMAMSFEMTPAI